MSVAVSGAPRAAALTAREAAARCPLCSAPAAEGRLVERIAYEAVWAGLARVWGARISPAVRARHEPQRETALLECAGCGLRFFAPVAPGDAEFYEELSTTSAYYSPEKWEFGVVRDRLARGRRVLDAGCGDGHFLRVLRGVAAQAVGIETNPEAVARARADGLEVRLSTIEEFARENPGRFDVVCSFHVLEHLGEVLPFARALLECVRPGGTLVVSVPNRQRMATPGELDPLDAPPHHVSRWDARQFGELARLLGARLERVAFDPPEMHEARAALRGRVERLLGRVGGRPGARAGFVIGRVIARGVFSPTLHPRLSAAGLLPRMGIYRHTMMAELVRP